MALLFFCVTAVWQKKYSYAIKQALQLQHILLQSLELVEVVEAVHPKTDSYILDGLLLWLNDPHTRHKRKCRQHQTSVSFGKMSNSVLYFLLISD